MKKASDLQGNPYKLFTADFRAIHHLEASDEIGKYYVLGLTGFRDQRDPRSVLTLFGEIPVEP